MNKHDFAAFVRRELPEMKKYAYKIVADHQLAEQAAASAVAGLWEKLEEGGFVQDHRALLVTLTKYCALTERNTLTRQRDREVPYGSSYELAALEEQRYEYLLAENSVEILYERGEFVDDFDQAIRDLDDEERDAFILTELRGLSQIEAGDVLGTHQATVSRRADSARQSLAKELSQLA